MLLDRIIGWFSHDISIDLGTANTIVIVKGQGVIINEPSVVAVRNDKYGKNKILAVGHEAKEMVGKTPGSILAVRPMKDGVIADFDMTEKMIRHFIEKAHRRKALMRPRIIVCVPYGLTGVERKAVRESAISAGAREVFLIEEPMAAAIGAGLPVKEPKGSLVVDIGGGTTEIGVISLGGLVISKSLRTAGDKLDNAIVDYIRRKYSLLIGERTGEIIKIQIGSAISLDEPLSMQVKGRDQVSGLLNTIELTSEDVREAIKEPLKEISNALKDVLEQMPPDLAGDIVENGIVLTGGGALIRGLDKYLSEIVKLPVYVGEEPLLCVAKGTGKALEEIDILQQLSYE
ncbi:rod shape-determining protein [Helicobacter pullorum]|uniref:Cell shape-determining protein MreB n=2 Tax=Helicobacter pullorum TaxID=35818 RepID=A0A0N0LTY5_9HELI|nr:rod shape-determining protein [Helicobacter pullorum]HIS09431.1 rod shape-determining protein [Candidatus Scatomorpha intestinipullorum]EEQ62634.1 rod shape-determining protein MreB [Helicobacter pullorum MIT 98-5489]KAB0576132.1 rod shape-determining protein [Helicobacter pullorum NCTC 12824]KPH51415.1 rod shape-determining protein MreB [Helicobacter pullorum]KPH54479.1 rod shape-determining protein MreB [Helicobacter pullorum]